MAAKKPISDNDIARLLLEDEELSSLEGSDSETEGPLEVDDVESDNQTDPSDDEEPETNTRAHSSLQLSDDVLEPAQTPDPSENSTRSSTSVLVLPQNNIRSRSRHVWATSKGRTSSRTSAVNIVRVNRGPTRSVRGLVDPLLLFEQFIIDQMLEEIVKWTNAEIGIKRQGYQQTTSTQNDTNKKEVRALIGIFVLTAALKDNHLSLDELFNSEFSGTRYVACMSKERCDFLLRCLRFDDKAYRLQRQNEDPFTPIRDMWEMLINQCRQNYEPGTNVTIDEQLLAFRGRCKFRMYIPNKPAKYGIKLVMLCDSGTRYMIDCTPYLGKGISTRGLPLGEYFVKELTRSIHGSNRNVTMDNWFTSVPLAKQLLQQPYKLTVVGTLRANKKEIPEEMKNNRSRKINTSMFCYDGCLTLLSYKPKPSKMVYLLSSCDEEGTVNPTTQKPHMIEFYNGTKGGVDTFDQMCSIMSCSRKTNRWPMCIFFDMINIACINSYVIYCHNASVLRQSIMSRRDFMKKLHSQLVEPWLKTRLQISTMPKHIKQKVEEVLAIKAAQGQPEDEGSSTSSREQSQASEAPPVRKRKVCGMCSYKKRRMTKSFCSKCDTAICGEHKVDFCCNCAAKN